MFESHKVTETYMNLNLNFTKLELYFYLNTVNLSDKIIIIRKITIYFNLYNRREGASPRKSVVQSSCQYDVMSRFGDFSKWRAKSLLMRRIK